MALTIGTQLGSHEITALLGKGGMGEVYRARDLKLKREVAIKILPEEFSRDSDRVSRFQREAEVLASLNHPNIAAIHDLEEANGTRYLVLELVGGETLADRLMRGPLPVDEAVQAARQIVDALEAAHERGIVHRDLKPGNIKRTPEGTVKVLDFGLAKSWRNPLPSEQGFSNSPTLMSGSMAGVILGTAPYMSPEQARGKDVDARTDIWAFGCVLYEMLTGKMAFSGETTTDILAKVLEASPKWEALPAQTPPSIRMLLEAALNKDPKQRLQHIGDARLFLSRPVALDKSASPVVHRKERHAWIVSAVLAVALAAALVPTGLRFMHPPAELSVTRFEMPAPGFANASNGGPAISPDGQRIAYVAMNGGKSAIWIRPIGSLTAQELPGTENAGDLFWAPDSHRLAFSADGRLKKIDISSGGVQTLGDAPSVASPGAWNRDGVILLEGPLGAPSGIVRISDSGGVTTPVSRGGGPFDWLQFLPRFLPDGRHFLFHTIVADGQTGNVYSGSLDSKSTTHLKEISNLTGDGSNSGVVYAQGYLLFSRDRTLLAQPFDPVRGTLSGEPAPVAENVGREFSVSETGVLVYRALPRETGQPVATHLSWRDRAGKPTGEINTPATVGSFSLSHDGRIAMDNYMLGINADIWVIDSRGVPNKLTADNPGYDATPQFSPDGNRVVFSSSRPTGAPHLYQKSSNGAGAAELLLPADDNGVDQPMHWSTSGIVFGRSNPSTLAIMDLWFLSMPEKKPSLYLHNGFSNGEARLSPDGRYIAYTTNESGSNQIVVQTFPNASGKWFITAQGGGWPMWKSDGRELYYLAPDGKIMAVAVKGDPTFQVGGTSELFQAPPTRGRPYAVSADGQRFLVAAPSTATSGDPIPITAVINWTAALKKK
jgi:serine/threonine protein kinase/Tol biopolymer transport system component